MSTKQDRQTLIQAWRNIAQEAADRLIKAASEIDRLQDLDRTNDLRDDNVTVDRLQQELKIERLRSSNLADQLFIAELDNELLRKRLESHLYKGD